MNYTEYEAFELVGKDVNKHSVWSRGDEDAVTQGKKWASRHGTLAVVNHLILNDRNDGCWDRATRRTVYAQ